VFNVLPHLIRQSAFSQAQLVGLLHKFRCRFL
jgi:hypothetical protein